MKDIRFYFPNDVTPSRASNLLLFMAGILLIIALFVILLSPHAHGNPLITNEGNTWTYSDFEDSTKWPVGTANTTATRESSIILDGSYALRLTVTNAASPSVEASGLNMLFTNTQCFVVNVWVNTGTIPVALKLYFANNAAYTKYMYAGPTVSWQRGWNRFVFTPADFNSLGASAMTWADTVARVKIIVTLTGNTGTLIYDHFTVNYVSKPRVLLAFYTGETGVYQNAYPILSANGQKATYFVNTGLVGSGTRTNTATLTLLKNAGWVIANNSVNKTATITGYNSTDMDTEVNGSYNWLVANGFVASGVKSYFWFPGGGTSDTLVDVVQANHLSGTTQGTSSFQAHQDTNSLSVYSYGIRWINSTHDTVTCEAEIDSLTQRQGLMIIAMQKCGQNSSSTQVSIGQLQAVSDYLKVKETAGLLKVETFTEYYNECWNIPSGASPPVYVGDGKKKRMKFYY